MSENTFTKNNTYKTSYGIAMCRYNKNKNNQPEILMIKKRYTYHYFSFIFGYYKKYNNKHLQYLFNNMTFGEKIDILSMKFNTMWYRLWICDPEKDYNIYNMYGRKKNTETEVQNLKYYFKKKAKFENIFMRDGGKRLKRFINNSSNSVTPWEIPKGNANPDETELDCARREFEEETSIYADKYTVLWDVKPIIVSHKDDNIIYRSVYYLAYFDKHSSWEPKVKFETTTQLSEVEAVQWVSLNEINFLNMNESSKKRLKLLYKNVIYNFKKKIKNTIL